MELFKDAKAEFVDERGSIFKLLDDGKTIIKSVLRITSKAGSIRANHYHKTDFHYCYMVTGKMEYTEAPITNESPVAFGEPKVVTVSAGEMVLTPPMVAHSMRFLEDSEFIAFAGNSRSQEAYESDTPKVKLI